MENEIEEWVTEEEVLDEEDFNEDLFTLIVKLKNLYDLGYRKAGGYVLTQHTRKRTRDEVVQGMLLKKGMCEHRAAVLREKIRNYSDLILDHEEKIRGYLNEAQGIDEWLAENTS